jgi:RimJ/RimL family protein N-acetyltransferase
MIDLTPNQVSPAIRTLFDLSKPTMPRAFNVLDGIANGQILTDPRVHPTWAAVREAGFGTLYLGGSITARLLAEIVDHFRQFGDVGIGCWPDDPLLAIIPPKPDYDGRTLYFTERSQDIRLANYIEQIPPDCSLRPSEQGLIEQSPDYELALATFGSVENILAHTLGFLLMRENILLCEASTGAPTHNRIEIGVSTPEQHRKHGYATITCAQLIAVCEAQGLRTWWDCAKQNRASAALAHKLGYQGEREYRYVLWSKR